jgi:hypothetical protein
MPERRMTRATASTNIRKLEETLHFAEERSRASEAGDP